MRELVAALSLLLFVACEPEKKEPPHAAPSPQASAEPTPLAVWVGSGGTRADAGPPLDTVRPDLALPADSLPKDPAVMHVDYSFRAVDPIALVRTPDTNVPFVDSLRPRMAAGWSLDFGAGRLRIALQGPSLLPEGTELRARADLVGSLAVHRASSSYRPLPPGSLRNFLGEGRFDVSPLLSFESTELGEGQRLGVKVRKVAVRTAVGSVTVELARVGDADPTGAAPQKPIDVGPMLCRLLSDFVLAPASALWCAADELPLYVDVRWASNRGGVVLDAKTLPRRAEVSATELLVPPKDAQYQLRAWQPFMSRALLQDGELGQLRTGAERIPLEVSQVVGGRPAEPVPDGLLLLNHRTQPYWLTLDGVLVAWVGAGSSLLLRGLQPGRYQAQWSTALDDAREAPEPVTVPGRAEVGIPPSK